MEYVDIEKAIAAKGLRLVLVAGTPSPWGQASKAMMEYKQLDFMVAAQIPGGENAALVAWAGINSGPVVAWNDEKPISRWDDILFLLDRLAPQRPLIPTDIVQRLQVFGLSQEICGELGLGWNRRLSLFQPAMQSGQAPEAILNMARKYRYNEADVAIADHRQVATLNLLTAELSAQRARSSQYFVGDALSAVDFYWAAFCNLFDILSPQQMPVADGFRAMLLGISPAVKTAVTPILIEHRDRIMREYFKLPIEF